MATSSHDSARWFAGELQPHEPMLRAWLQSRFPTGCDVDDIIQEAYFRVLKAHEISPLQSPKAFLFATARNLALDQLRRRKVACTDALAETDALHVMEGDPGIPETLAHTQELEVLTLAIQSLPTRCRQILTLRKIYGLSQKEVAAELGISEHTVEAQGTIGLRKLAEYFERFERRGGREP